MSTSWSESSETSDSRSSCEAGEGVYCEPSRETSLPFCSGLWQLSGLWSLWLSAPSTSSFLVAWGFSCNERILLGTAVLTHLEATRGHRDRRPGNSSCAVWENHLAEKGRCPAASLGLLPINLPKWDWAGQGLWSHSLTATGAAAVNRAPWRWLSQPLQKSQELLEPRNIWTFVFSKANVYYESTNTDTQLPPALIFL